MRKWLLLLLLSFVFVVGAVYVLIPNKIVLREEVKLAVNAKAFSRTILNDNSWKQWWPADVDSAETIAANEGFIFHANQYRILEKTSTYCQIAVRYGHDTLLSRLLFVPLSNDTVLISWEATAGTSYVPHKRFTRYRQLKSLQQDWEAILQRLNTFYTNDSNIYETVVRKETVIDSSLVTTVIKTNQAPSVDTIYNLIDELKSFALRKGAKQNGLPMLNTSRITEDDRVVYRTQVALPVDKKLADEGKIQYRWMFGGGKILVTEVKGGPATISNAFQQMENYLTDHNLVAPAIPFQSLVTDRRNEPDTSKWVTKVYWPVM